MVTGANTGLGFEATKHFAAMNAGRLILACRNQEKGTSAVEKLRVETGYERAELQLLDLNELSSVIEFADKFEKDGGRLDILVHNASVAVEEYTVTSDGWESTLQVNCLAPFLLALRLLPRIIQTANEHSTHPRMVFVTSDSHHLATIPGKVLAGENTYKTMSTKKYNRFVNRRYNDSKLLEIFFYRALNERLGPRSPVIVNGVNPGYCISEIRRNLSPSLALVLRLVDKLIARTTEEGSRQLVYAAVACMGSEDEDRLRGAYISSSQVAEARDLVVGVEGWDIQDKLWKEVIDILSDVDPGVKDIMKLYLSNSS
ncbi:hypothetical protein H0H92_015524 [Tricholoma furcatifolium]|nr:hypothetical protein H0H92_015524 [Tricholoma furcatifolium]